MKLRSLRPQLGNTALLLFLLFKYARSSSALSNQSTTCNEECQQLVQLGVAFETKSHAHTPLDEFYSIPETFNPSMKAGTLLRVETHTNLTDYTIPSGLTMSRIMYTSQNLNGIIVPASAFVLWPYAPFQYTNGEEWHGSQQQASYKFPLVAWAHGTAGYFVNCAPSNYRSLQYHFMTSYPLALEGFAVVATDYAGLGVTTRPDGEQALEWLAGPSGANDVAYAIEAARAAFPEQLEEDGPFVAMGHSQGGNVAWAFAERQVELPVPGLNFALILAALGPSRPRPPAQHNCFYNDCFPSYNFSGMTPTSYDRWNNVLKPLRACLPTEGLAFANVSLDQLAKPGLTNDSIAQLWQEKAAVSGKNFQGPLLVIAGENDVQPVDFVEQSVSASCRASANQSLEMFTYQAMEHFPVIQASRSNWMRWIKDRISAGAAERARNNTGFCGKNTFVEGFNTNYTLQFITPNWLVDWVATQEKWELAL